MPRNLALTALIGVSLLLAACNTVRGVGRDLASVGETVADAAE